MKKALVDTANGQISLTGLHTRAVASGSPHNDLIGYNVQSAINTNTHIIVTPYCQDALISVALRASRLRKRSGVMSDLFWLSAVQMAGLEPFFPKSHGKPRVDDRRVLSGIIFINRNGLRWRDAPREYGPHKTLYSRWKRWSEKGVFARMMAGLAAGHGEKKTVMIDATYLKAHGTATSMAAKKGGVVA
jgi:transposase